MTSISEREAAAIRAAIGAGVTPDAWAVPVHAVERALGLTSEQSRELLADLKKRKLLSIRAKARDGREWARPASWWELGPEHPDRLKAG